MTKASGFCRDEKAFEEERACLRIRILRRVFIGGGTMAATCDSEVRGTTIRPFQSARGLSKPALNPLGRSGLFGYCSQGSYLVNYKRRSKQKVAVPSGALGRVISIKCTEDYSESMDRNKKSFGGKSFLLLPFSGYWNYSRLSLLSRRIQVIAPKKAICRAMKRMVPPCAR